MAITVTPTATGSEFDFGDLGKYVVAVEDDAGTERVVARYNGTRTSDVTPSGGHTEQRQIDNPAGFERI